MGHYAPFYYEDKTMSFNDQLISGTNFENLAYPLLCEYMNRNSTSELNTSFTNAPCRLTKDVLSTQSSQAGSNLIYNQTVHANTNPGKSMMPDFSFYDEYSVEEFANNENITLAAAEKTLSLFPKLKIKRIYIEAKAKRRMYNYNGRLCFVIDCYKVDDYKDVLERTGYNELRFVFGDHSNNTIYLTSHLPPEVCTIHNLVTNEYDRRKNKNARFFVWYIDDLVLLSDDAKWDWQKNDD